MAKAKYMEFRRLDVMSVAKLASLFGVIVGLVIGVLFAFVSSFSVYMDGVLTSANFGATAIIIFPIMYGIMYFVCGAIGALVYNLIAGKIGGIKVLVR